MPWKSIIENAPVFNKGMIEVDVTLRNNPGNVVEAVRLNVHSEDVQQVIDDAGNETDVGGNPAPRIINFQEALQEYIADWTENVVLRDRRTDPFQLRDIAAQHPDVVARLRRDELEPWLRRTGDPWSAR